VRGTNLGATRTLEPATIGEGERWAPGRRVVVLVSSDLP
jgi:hypothetical protein